jgi:periplasmic protein TonB
MDLKRDLIESSRGVGSRGWKASIASILLHGLILGGVIYAGTEEITKEIAEETAITAFVTQGAAPPPPPPPPPPAPSSGAPEPEPTVLQPVEVPKTPRTLTPPVDMPKEVPAVQPASTIAAIEVPREVLPPPQTSASSGSAGGSPAVGGVPGGVAGGVAGGEIGGVVGGQLGGVKGGELGGVVGGQLGGVVGGVLGGTGQGAAGEGTGGLESPVEAPTGPLRVGGDVKAPVAIDRSEPNYTELARKAKVTGIVVVEAVIDKNGNVQDVRVVKDLPMGLSDEAIKAVKKWKFKPGTLNGRAVATIFNLTINFKLN